MVTRRAVTVIVAAVCTPVLGCSRSVLSAVLDFPAPSESATALVDTVFVATTGQVAVMDTVRPEIESWLDPDSVVARLPRDHAGNIDWMQALQAGTINPRSVLPGVDQPPPTGFEFKFDFFYPGPDTMIKALFPHSSHTQWVDCQQCHPRIFPGRATEISMGEIFQGKFCGECHGKVAFPVTTACERCHVNLSMPPARAPAQLIGTIAMHRIKRPVADGGPEGAAEAAMQSAFLTDALPPAQFPHWVHRIRFRCKACHMGLFEPRAGASRITMEDIGQGKACGACHDGISAFAAGFGACQRCHVDAAADDGPE